MRIRKVYYHGFVILRDYIFVLVVLVLFFCFGCDGWLWMLFLRFSIFIRFQLGIIKIAIVRLGHYDYVNFPIHGKQEITLDYILVWLLWHGISGSRELHIPKQYIIMLCVHFRYTWRKFKGLFEFFNFEWE